MGDAVGLPEVPAPAKSVAEHLRESFAKAQQVKTQDLIVPGYDELHVVFRALDDYTELRKTLRFAQNGGRHLDEAAQEIQAAISVLVLASVDSYAVVDGQRVDIGLKLGLPLYDFLYPPDGEGIRPSTDGEAVVMFFGGDTVSLMMFAGQLSVWNKVAAAQAEAELAGNS